MRKLESMVIILALFPLLLSCTSSGDDDDDADFGQDADDDDADPKDDDDADDNDALACGLIWAECDYQYPYDEWIDDCNDYKLEFFNRGGWPELVEDQQVRLCVASHESDRYESLADCGAVAGCDDDWKYEQYTCWANYYDVLYDCAETASGMEGLSAEQYYETCFENADGIKDECEDI